MIKNGIELIFKKKSFYTIFVFSMVMLISLNSCFIESELSKTDRKNYKTGIKLSEKGEYELALDYFLEVYENVPHNIDNLYIMTLTYSKQFEDYDNTLKFGSILLDDLKKEIDNPSLKNNNKRYIHTQKLLNEIELLIEESKLKVEPSLSKQKTEPIQLIDSIMTNNDLNYTEKAIESIYLEFKQVGNNNLIVKINNNPSYNDTSNQTIQHKIILDTILLDTLITKSRIFTLQQYDSNNLNDSMANLDINNFEFHYNIFIDTTIIDPSNYSLKQPIELSEMTQSNQDKEDIIMTPEKEIYKVSTISGTNMVIDQRHNKWKILEDNPSSYTSYVMYQEENGWRLPTYTELSSLFTNLLIDSTIINKLDWPVNNVIYISSDSHYDNRNNKLYRGIELNNTFYQETNVHSGDEVYLIVITE